MSLGFAASKQLAGRQNGNTYCSQSDSLLCVCHIWKYSNLENLQGYQNIDERFTGTSTKFVCGCISKKCMIILL